MEPAVIVGLGMAGLFAAVLWLGWRRRPRQVPARMMTGVYRDQWRRFQNLNRLSVGIFLLNPLSWFLVDFERVDKSTVAVFLVIWMISLAAVTVYATSFFRCPRCQNHYYGFGTLPRRSCVHCGLQLYEGA